MTTPLWALAAGCVPDAAPWDIPRIAAAAGFRSSGMWVDPKTTWGRDALAKTQQALSETGIALVDVEVAWLEKNNRATDTQKLIVDVGLALGARNLLVVSRHEDYNASIEQFRDVCDRAGNDLRVCLEFGEFTQIKSLQAANAFIDAVDHPSAGILIDLMHIARSKEPLPDLTGSRFPYLQACDFLQSSTSMTGRDYIQAAVDDRYCLGEGEADATRMSLVRHANIDVSLEIRSRALREAFPDPIQRAQAIFSRCGLE
ncbi:MAG: TIM barrel protein [Gammaproteobacteria bacterium]|jgi:sugar phosphate isomerase/epimerase|nr:TIM barrel protein [Gammaproteobacteria bacterium]